MLLFHIIILSLVQGITEFLPISSSGHLSLLHSIFDGESAADQYATNHLFDIAVHVGTLFAVLLYFRRDVFEMLMGLICIANPQKQAAGVRALQVGVASIPVIIAGFILHAWSPNFLTLLSVVAWANIVYALLLWVADRTPVAQVNGQDKSVDEMPWRDAMIIGVSQALALVPGTSRSGVTMTAARFLGYPRTDAARFSMFLGMVAISGAGLLGALDVDWQNSQLGADIALAVIFSFLAALTAIALLMRWIEKSSFTPFVIYRLIFGVVLLLAL